MPCGGLQPHDAAIDTLGRIWVAFANCDDVRIYRFTPSGDLDISLQGSGFVAIDFPDAQVSGSGSVKIAVTPENGIFFTAGISSGGQNPRLAVAHYDSDGNPEAFGVDGIGEVPLQAIVKKVNKVHLMDNGRVVIDGSHFGSKVFVARLLASGIADGGFGNIGPGLSVADFQALLNPPLEAPVLNDSVLERDGSLVQFGYRVRSNTESNRDFMIVKWRPDGLLDNSVGPHGHRSYALDFGGPNPNEPASNWDIGYHIVRQGDGKLVLVGKAFVEGSGLWTGVSLLRLKRNLDVDTGFGQNGRILHWLQMGSEFAENTMDTADVRLVPGRILVGASTRNADYYNYQTVVAVQNDLLFADTFD